MATSGRITKALLPDEYDARIKKIWIQGYGEPEHEYEKVLRTMNIDTEDTRFSYISGFGQWQQKGSTGTVPFDSIYQGYDSTCTPYTYWLAFDIDQETVEDDPHGLLGGPMATALAQAGRETLETLMATPFNASTSTSYCSPWQTGSTVSAPDGVVLLSTSHPILSGGTYANTPSSPVDLSITTLQAARTRMEKMQGARGQRWSMQAEQLVVPTDSRWLVGEILGSEKLPYTADNTPNLVREGLTSVIWSRLTDTDCWFLLARKAGQFGQKGHMATAVIRISPEFDRDTVFLSGDRRYKGRMRVGLAIPDFRGIDGSTGGA